MKKRFKNPGQNLGFFFRKLFKTSKVPGISALVIVLFFVTLILLLSTKKKVPIQYCVPATLTFSAKNIHVSTIGYASGSARRTILIVPPTPGQNSFDSWYAKKLCDAGMNTYVLVDWTSYPMQKPQLDSEQAEQALQAVVSSLSSKFIGVFANGERAAVIGSVISKVKRVNAALLVSPEEFSVRNSNDQQIRLVQSVPWTLQYREVINFFINADKK